ncbi:hypothetical protein L3X38_033921 [Prunus dulcis]|uniref:DDE Tnp4 domain-containing protein n=1 Tax=Prunus dulcis TaxID=3755 RepID=A0AAD4YY26_PRUDU|nr:hypothetical protein L3X38_033921 [Prunus dulcis]
MIGSIDCMHCQSPVFNDVLRGEAPNITYEINNTIYQNGYYLVDGIYLRWTTFVKTITHPRSHKQNFFARYQEGYRKDVERCFGILQARWAIIRGVARLFDEEKRKNSLEIPLKASEAWEFPLRPFFSLRDLVRIFD